MKTHPWHHGLRDQEMVSVLSDQWKGLARASVEQDDPVIPISQVDWSSMTSVVYDPLHAHPSISRRDRIRIFLSHLMSMDGRVFFQLFIRQRNVRLWLLSHSDNILGVFKSDSTTYHSGLFLQWKFNMFWLLLLADCLCFTRFAAVTPG